MSHAVAVLAASELPEGQGRCVEAEGRAIAVFRTGRGLFAIDDECPHMGARLSEGWLEGESAVCPLHLWQFRLADGVGTTEPGSCVRSYGVEESDGQIWIRLA